MKKRLFIDPVGLLTGRCYLHRASQTARSGFYQRPYAYLQNIGSVDAYQMH